MPAPDRRGRVHHFYRTVHWNHFPCARPLRRPSAALWKGKLSSSRRPWTRRSSVRCQSRRRGAFLCGRRPRGRPSASRATRRPRRHSHRNGDSRRQLTQRPRLPTGALHGVRPVSSRPSRRSRPCRPFPPRTVHRLTRASPPPPPSESRLRHCPPRALASARCVRVRDPWTRGPCPLCAANEHKNDHATSDAIKHGALTSQQPRPARSLCQRLTSRCRGADRVAPRARTRPSCSRPAQTDPARAPGRGGGPGNATAHAGTHPAQGTPRDARRAPWQRPGPAPRSAERACRQRPRVGPACRDSASEESLNDR